MIRFVDLLLSPVYYYQGKQLRKTAVRLPEPPGEREGVTGSGNTIRLLVLGDSSAAGVGASYQDEALLGSILKPLSKYYSVEYRLMAKTGASTRNSINRLKREPDKSFDVVVTALGVNDLTGNRSVSDWTKDQTELIELLRSKFSASHIILSGLPPVSKFPILPFPLRWYLGRKAKRFTDALHKISIQKECGFVSVSFESSVSEMASDGFHPGPAIYRKWGTIIAEKIQLLLQTR